jgi:hypothetical protein
MGVPNFKYVAKAVEGGCWRIWNRRTSRWWGNPFSFYPEELLAELNGPNRIERIIELCKRK